MTNDPTAAEALASIETARGALGDRLQVHWSYDLFYGLACGLLVAGQGLPQPYAVLTVPVAMGALALMVRWWKAKTGFWVNGFSPRGARWVALGLGALLVSLMLGSLYLTRVADLWWGPLVTGGIATIVAIFASRMWMRAYRRDLARSAV